MMPQEFWRSHAGQLEFCRDINVYNRSLALERLIGQRARAGFHIES
jgi:hypothetical protein